MAPTSSTRVLVYTLPPGYTVADLTLPAGHVEVRGPSDGWIVSFMRRGVADPSVRCRGPEDLRASPGDAMTFDQAELAALEYIRRDIPAGSSNIHVMPVASLLPRRFRLCWRQSGAAPPHVDMPLARQQRMAEIREERDRRLARSDGQWARALDIGTPGEVAALKTYRQALRDVPQRVTLDAVATPTALAEYDPMWPA